MLKNSLYKIHHLPPKQSNEPHYPTVYPLVVGGAGTGQLECLVGYLMRLAELHSMTTESFVNHAIYKKTIVELRKKRPVQLLALYMANGYGKYANDIGRQLDKCSTSTRQIHLNFMPWFKVFNNRGVGLIKKHQAWCPQCWQADKASGHTPYLRLAWVAQPVTLCAHHHCHLQSACPHCGNHQLVGSTIPRPWTCATCGNDMTDCTKSIRAEDNKSNDKQYWIAKAVEKLIARTCAQGHSLAANCFTSSLKEIIEAHSNGSIHKFCDQVNLDKVSVGRWVSGESLPTLPALLELAYRIDVPPDVLLLSQKNLMHSRNWREEEKPRFVIKQNIDPKLKATIQKTLSDYIASSPVPPPLITEIANQFNVRYMLLKYHWPTEVTILKKRSDHYRKLLNSKKNRARITRLIHSVAQLTKQGKYPSQRQLKYLGYVRPSDLRRPEILDRLRELQQNFSDQPLKNMTETCSSP